MTLERKLILNSFIPDILSAVIIFAYILITTQLPLANFWDACKYVFALVIVAQFVVAPVVDHIMYKSISRQCEEFDKKELSETERTEFLERIMQYPFVCAVYTALYFVVGTIIQYIIFRVKMQVPQSTCIVVLIEGFMGTYFSALYAYNYSNKIFSEVACKVIKAGVNKKYIMTKKYFGARISRQIFMYITLPLIVTTIITCLVVITGFLLESDASLAADKRIQQVILTAILNITLQVVLVVLFFKRISFSNKKMTDVLNSMRDSDLTTAQLLETDLEDEISYNHYLANQMLILFRKLLSNSIDIGKSITKSAQDLIKVSNETEATAVEQSTGTNEIVSTMEGANHLSHDIEAHIAEVTDLAIRTADDVSSGSRVLAELLGKISDIQESNNNTMDGISDLNEKINSIWEIVTIINSIADQTKIIAFNAELEATGVHEGGKNFRNVANEIRHLANSTMDSTKEIKKRINEMQLAADSLIKGSQESTKQIKYGADISKELDRRFSNIRLSADNNASSAEEIKQLVTQQSAAFEQIVKTLHQISNGIQNFSVSTRTIIDTSNVLSQSANDLGSISGANTTGVEK